MHVTFKNDLKFKNAYHYRMKCGETIVCTYASNIDKFSTKTYLMGFSAFQRNRPFYRFNTAIIRSLENL